MHRSKLRRYRAGFTLAEALMALALAAMAGSSLLLASYASMYHTADALDSAMATGVAEQLLDEITGLPYKEKGMTAYGLVLGPDAGETTREYFDDLDDYNGYSVTGIKDRWGVSLGQSNGSGGVRDPAFHTSSSFFQWYATVSVAYVNEADVTQTLGPGLTSGLRAVEVVVKSSSAADGRELARLRRVVGYAPSE
jgi:hypothetical protein